MAKLSSINKNNRSIKLSNKFYLKRKNFLGKTKNISSAWNNFSKNLFKT